MRTETARTASGWTAGGGVEYAFWKNLSVRAEFFYVNLGGGDTVRVTALNGGGFTPSSLTQSGHERLRIAAVQTDL